MTGKGKIAIAAGIMVIIAFSGAVSGQTTMGILPVNTEAVKTTVLDARQWQIFSTKIQEYFMEGMGGKIISTKLTREHILLLLKEVPAPDPEKLTEEAFQIISKKEKLHYLLKFSVEDLQVSSLNVSTQIRTTIIDGNNGKVFWEKPAKSSRGVSVPVHNEQVLLDEVFKPLVTEISKEIKSLNY